MKATRIRYFFFFFFPQFFFSVVFFSPLSLDSKTAPSLPGSSQDFVSLVSKSKTVLPPSSHPMRCGAAEATGPGFVCFDVINPRVLLVFVIACFCFLLGVSDYSVCEYLYANILHRNFLSYAGVIGCGAAEATDLGFVCFVINPCVLLATELIWVFFCFINFQILPPPPPECRGRSSRGSTHGCICPS